MTDAQLLQNDEERSEKMIKLLFGNAATEEPDGELTLDDSLIAAVLFGVGDHARIVCGQSLVAARSQ